MEYITVGVGAVRWVIELLWWWLSYKVDDWYSEENGFWSQRVSLREPDCDLNWDRFWGDSATDYEGNELVRELLADEESKSDDEIKTPNFERGWM